jgi:hypothetical protein
MIFTKEEEEDFRTLAKRHPLFCGLFEKIDALRAENKKLAEQSEWRHEANNRYAAALGESKGELEYARKELARALERIEKLGKALEKQWEAEHYEYCGAEHDPDLGIDVYKCPSVFDHIKQRWQALAEEKEHGK